MTKTIVFTNNEFDFISANLSVIIPDMIYDDDSKYLSRKELIKLANKLNIAFNEKDIK